MGEFREDVGEIEFSQADMPLAALMESVLEMIASRFQRINTLTVPLKQLFQPQELLMINYTNPDRKRAREIMENWRADVEAAKRSDQLQTWEHDYNRKIIIS
jgi:hypothetical protein